MGKPAATDRPRLTSLSHSFTLDAVVHCRNRKQAEQVMRSIVLRLTECGLTMHPEKSRIVYCKSSGRNASYPHVQFTFLGFTFRPRRAVNRQGRRFTSFTPGVSVDALKRMRKEVRGWRIHRRTATTLAELAKQYNPVLRGWWNYFGEFYPSAMHSFAMYLDGKLMQWARRKYQTPFSRGSAAVQWNRGPYREQSGRRVSLLCRRTGFCAAGSGIVSSAELGGGWAPLPGGRHP